MKTVPGRRSALMMMGAGIVGGLAAAHDNSAIAAEPSLLPPQAGALKELTARLQSAPRRLIAGVVLTPGMVGTLPELQRVGFHYASSSA